jgi:protein phosphatase
VLRAIAAGLTDVGLQRDHNEDSYAVLSEYNLYIVADGMGGHRAGDVASRMATESIADFFRSTSKEDATWPFHFDTSMSEEENRLVAGIRVANRQIFERSLRSRDCAGMGTTVVAVLVSPGEARMTYANVGDSRVYLIRDRAMLQITRDDSWANLGWSGGGEDATNTSMKNILTKALGAREDVEFDVMDQTLQDGDIVLLCSDGLTNMVPDARINEIVGARPGDIPGACRDLIGEANAQGGRDNVSLILVEYKR